MENDRHDEDKQGVATFRLGKRAVMVAGKGLAIPEIILRNGLSANEIATYVALKWIWGMSDGVNAVQGACQLTGLAEQEVIDAMIRLANLRLVDIQDGKIVLPWFDTQRLIAKRIAEGGKLVVLYDVH